MELSVVVLAAGEGKRFKSTVPKPLHQVAGRPLLWHVLRAASGLGADRTVVVVGRGADDVRAAVEGFGLAQVRFAVQAEQRGTGDALASALPVLPGIAGPAGADLAHDDAPGARSQPVLVLYADTPLLQTETLERLVEQHRTAGAMVTMLTCRSADPAGYGRVVRDPAGAVTRVVEERDASSAELAIDEVNAGMYVFERGLLDQLDSLGTNNDQGERYLPDLLELAVARGARLGTVEADPVEVLGVNDRAQLATAGAVLRRRTLDRLLRDGVTVVDPATAYVDVDVEVAADTTLLPLTFLESGTRIAAGCTIGPNVRLVGCSVAEEATVTQAVCVGASIGPRAQVGPFAYLRPGAELGPGAKAGTYVEIKGSRVGAGSKVPHLSYVGDAEIGEGVNVGAGTVFVNYDGVRKHRTRVGDGAFIGSDSMLVAPLTIGPGAMTAAGSTITKDVPPDAIAIERDKQRVIEGAAARRRERLRGGAEGSAVRGAGEGARAEHKDPAAAGDGDPPGVAGAGDRDVPAAAE